MDKQIFNEEHRELLEEKHQNTIQNIRELQEMEKYMYQNLAKLSGEGASASQEDQVIARINELKQMRINLFDQLKTQYSDAAEDLNDSRRSLRDQLMSVEVVEEELNNAKKNLSTLTNNRTNKMRMVEIGTYQAERYNAHIDVLKIISFTALVVIIISAVYHRDLIPGKIATLLIVAALSVGGILTIRKVIDLMNRSNLVYDQYSWNTNHSQLQPGYQGVLKHDEIFFDRVGQELEGKMVKGESDLKHAGNVVDETITKHMTKEVVVQPTHSTSKESFSVYH
jgi:predicted DNA-binding protein (UPF0251 family)